MKKNEKDLQQSIIKDREAILQAGLLASMEILKDEFGFDEVKLKKFADAYLPALKNNLNPKK
jgi:hypothetical protein